MLIFDKEKNVKVQLMAVTLAVFGVLAGPVVGATVSRRLLLIR